jgi:EAL domain-containing protein (putative c-di-GMP-specific phosphodiesterase class I)
LNYLRTYRVSHLKIAQTFIDASASDTERSTTMRAILNLADELGIGVITQGVETSEQCDRSNATSTVAQGFYFSEAMDAADATGLLRVGSIDLTPAATGIAASPDAVDRPAKAPSGRSSIKR